MHSNKQNSCQKDHFPKRGAQVKYWASLIFSSLLCLFGVLYSGYSIIHTRRLITVHGRAILLIRLPLPVFLILISIAIGIILIFYQANHHHDSIFTSNEGLAIHDGKNIISVRWQEIIRMDTRFTDFNFGRSIFFSKREIVLENIDHKQYIIRDRYVEMGDLINKIRSNVLSHLYIEAVTKMNESTPISFHKDFLAEYQGLKFQHQSIPWHSFRNPEIRRNRLIIRDNEPDKQILINIKLSKINNLDLLLLLCEIPPYEVQLSAR